MFHTDETDAVFPHDYALRDGRLHVGDTLASASTSTRSGGEVSVLPRQLPIARLKTARWDW